MGDGDRENVVTWRIVAGMSAALLAALFGWGVAQDERRLTTLEQQLHETEAAMVRADSEIKERLRGLEERLDAHTRETRRDYPGWHR